MKYATRVKPNMQINTEAVLSGFTNLEWYHASSMEFFVENMTHPMERGAVLSFVYLSLFHGYRIADARSLLHFLKAVIHACPHILAEEAYIVRSFVYILAVCQTNTCESADVVFEGSGIAYISDLERLPVEAWYTAGPAVFKWAFLTREKMKALAKPVVEYWLVQLNLPLSQLGFKFEDLTDEDKAIITTMISDINFLESLMGFLNSSHVGTKASSVLIYCIAQLSEMKMWEIAPSVLMNLLSVGTQTLDALFVQSTDLDCILANNLLHVLCALLKSPVSDSLPVSWFKSVYNVVKLFSKCWDQEDTLTPALQYFSEIVGRLSFEDSQTIIPVVLESEKCISFLETALENPSNKLFSQSLAIVVWLAGNGQLYDAKNFVTVKSHLLLNYLAICISPCNLLILRLLKYALTAMADRHTMFGACHFFKSCEGFIPSKIFSFSELRQIYGYLQQYVSQEDSSLRLEAIECIQKLTSVGADMEHYVLQHPWNSAMLETLSSRSETGVQDFELTFFSMIKDCQVKVDTCLMEAAEVYFQNCEDW